MQFNIRVFGFTSIILVTFLLVACDKKASSTIVKEGKITAEEQGVIEYIEKDLNKIIVNYNKLIESREKYFKYKKDNKKHSMALQLKKYNQALEKLKFAVINNRLVQGKQRRLLYPKNMQPLFHSLFNYYRFQFSRYSKRLPPEKERELINLAERVHQADRQLAQQWRQRKIVYSRPDWEGNVSVQNAFSPVKISYSRDGFRIKFVQRVGPAMIIVSAGQGRRGIKTLVIQNANSQRRFAIGRKNIKLDVPASQITTRGDTMYITAASAVLG